MGSLCDEAGEAKTDSHATRRLTIHQHPSFTATYCQPYSDLPDHDMTDCLGYIRLNVHHVDATDYLVSPSPLHSMQSGCYEQYLTRNCCRPSEQLLARLPSFRHRRPLHCLSTHVPPGSDENAEAQEILLWDRKAEGGFPKTKVLKQRPEEIISSQVVISVTLTSPPRLRPRAHLQSRQSRSEPCRFGELPKHKRLRGLQA